MRNYEVHIIAETSMQIEAESPEQAEEIALDEAVSWMLGTGDYMLSTNGVRELDG